MIKCIISIEHLKLKYQIEDTFYYIKSITRNIGQNTYEYRNPREII